MNRHHLGFFLPQWIEHKSPANLRTHVVIYAISWLAVVTLLSQIPAPITVPLLGRNMGAVFTVLSVLYWLPADLAVGVAAAAWTAAWAHLPFAPWGPGHGWFVGVALPLGVFTAMGVTAYFAHAYHHEHGDFMKGHSRVEAVLETVHSLVWAPFYFWLIALLRAGYRPGLRAFLDAGERAAILRRDDVPWSNWAATASCTAARVCVPQTVEDLPDIVREAAAEGRRVRVVASGFSWSSLVPTSDVLVFCERLDRITVDASDPQNPCVWVEAGVTNRALHHALQQHGLAMPWNVALETVRLGGLVSIGSHGSGKNTATMSDLCEALEIVDAKGETRHFSRDTVGEDAMQAARMGMGMFGIIARMKLRVVTEHAVRRVSRRTPIADALANLAHQVRDHESVELFWFPGSEDVWVETADRAEPSTGAPRGHGFAHKLRHFLRQNAVAVLAPVVDRLIPRFGPTLRRWLMRRGSFDERVVGLTESNHDPRWLELLKCGAVEVGFKVSPDLGAFSDAWAATVRLTKAYQARGMDPLNLAVNVRFIGPSEALLSAAYGPGVTCFIEARCAGRARGWAQFSAELCAEWMKIPGALPHWAKEFEHVPGITALSRERLGDRLERFLAAWRESGVDPQGMFVNPLLQRLLLGEEPEGAAGAAEGPLAARDGRGFAAVDR
jgi:uncharacterized membrane protein YGL010W